MITETKAIKISDAKSASPAMIKEKSCILFEMKNGKVCYFTYETEEERDEVLSILFSESSLRYNKNSFNIR